ncbi:unnamed protein product [Caenorhabditis angaria]|uniref:Uncharacterized protein n=1 Tax=Caenorhabditis angaria TaxID=860376 RepID=A0A9P1ISW0_9PELO|nr:unnamed protein product [Caenorhabditis angaria]
MSISISCSADFKLKQIHVIGIEINFKFDILVTTILILGDEASWIRKKVRTLVFSIFYKDWKFSRGTQHHHSTSLKISSSSQKPCKIVKLRRQSHNSSIFQCYF